MTADLGDGLDPCFEYFLTEPPADPEVRDSATLWIMDQGGTLALPRVTFDAIGADWDMPWVQLNFVHSDGRTMRVWSRKPGYSAMDLNGEPSIRGAGPLRFRCIEPFRSWSMEFDGVARQSTTLDELAGRPEAGAVRLAFSFEAQMAAPPWLMGGLTVEAARKMKEGDGSALMGGVRYEQLCRVTGHISVDGEEYRINGTGMRVRRRGVRNMGAAMGHCQHSALFPSGRGFGAIVMAPGPDGPEAFNEAFLLTEEGRQLPARVVQAPWMRRLSAAGDDATLVLESELGRVLIEGEVLLSMFDHDRFEMASVSILHQGTARYVWDGEETIGLIERCALRDSI